MKSSSVALAGRICFSAVGLNTANPPGFPADPPFAQSCRLVARLDLPES